MACALEKERRKTGRKRERGNGMCACHVRKGLSGTDRWDGVVNMDWVEIRKQVKREQSKQKGGNKGKPEYKQKQ